MSQKRSALFLTVLVVIAALIIAAVVRFASVHAPQKKGGGKPPTSVAVAVVAQQAFPETVEVLGILAGERSASLSTPSAERIERVLVPSGALVKSGQPLIQLSQAEESADMAAARAELAEAQQNYKRADELVQKGILPAARLDSARAARDAAVARVRALGARGADRVLRAPFDGVVGLISVQGGDLARPGDILVTVDDPARLRADLRFAERDLAVLAKGASVTGLVEAWPDRQFSGTLIQVSSRVDPASGLIAARAVFDNADGALRPGMTIRATLIKRQSQALAVPEGAIQYDADRQYVYVLKKAEKGFELERREVVATGRAGELVAIASGLTAGERIVAAGLNRIRPGDMVIPAQDMKR